MLLSKPERSLNKNTFFSLYNSLILPYLNYCIHVWGKAYETHLNHLIKMQHKAVRLIVWVTPRTNTVTLYSELNIMPLKSLYIIIQLFANMFSQVDEVHTYNTRNSANNRLYTSFHPTRRGQKCVKYTGHQVWNFILSRINPCCSIGCFKKSLVSLLKQCPLSDLPSWNSLLCWVACSKIIVNSSLQDLIGLKFAKICF